MKKLLAISLLVVLAALLASGQQGEAKAETGSVVYLPLVVKSDPVAEMDITAPFYDAGVIAMCSVSAPPRRSRLERRI